MQYKALHKLSKPTFRISQVTEHFQTEINFQRIVAGERTDRGQTFIVIWRSGGEIPSSCRENQEGVKRAFKRANYLFRVKPYALSRSRCRHGEQDHGKSCTDPATIRRQRRRQEQPAEAGAETPRRATQCTVEPEPNIKRYVGIEN